MTDTIQQQLPGVMLAIAFAVGEYLLVLCAVLADLASGLRKARQRGETRRSKALRRTVEKLATYYNASAYNSGSITVKRYIRSINTGSSFAFQAQS